MGAFDDLTPGGKGGAFDDLVPQEGDFSRGIKQGSLGLKGAGGGLLALAGKAIGSEGLTNYGLDVFKGAEQRSQELSRPTDSLAGIGGVGDFLDFAQHGLGVAAPSIIASIASGGVGALLGRELARRGAIAMAQKAAAQAGGIAGATVGSVAPATGGIYPEALAEGVDNPELRAIGGGLASGALDVLPVLRAARQTGLIGRLAREAVPESMLGKAGMAAREVGKQMAFEGGTEGAQTLIERGAAGKALDTPEAIQEVLDSIAVGSIAGGAMGLPGAAMRIRQQPEQPLDTRLQDRPVDTAAGDRMRAGLEQQGLAGEEYLANRWGPNQPTSGMPDMLMPGSVPDDRPTDLAAGDVLRQQANPLDALRERLDPAAGPISRALFDDMGLVNEFQQQAAATAALPAPGQPLSKVVPGSAATDDQGAAEAQANADRVQTARAAEEARQASLRDLEARINAERQASAAEAQAAREQAFARAEAEAAKRKQQEMRQLGRDAVYDRAIEDATARPGVPPNNAIAEAFARRQAQSAAAPQPSPQKPTIAEPVAAPATDVAGSNADQIRPISAQSVPADAPAFLKGQARMMAASATKRGTPSDVVPHPVEPGKFAVVPRVQAPASSAPADIAPTATVAQAPTADIAPSAPVAQPAATQGASTLSPVQSPRGIAPATAAPVAQAVAPAASLTVSAPDIAPAASSSPAVAPAQPAKFDGAQWLKDTKRLGLSLDVDLARAGEAKDQWEAKFGGMTSGPQPTQTAAAEALAAQLSAKPAAPKGPPANAVRLRDQAAKIEERANESLGRDRNTNTARRARMASSAEGEARKEAQKAATMRRVADAIEHGEAKKLANVTTASQVDTLERLAQQALYEDTRGQGLSERERLNAEAEGPQLRHVQKAEMPRLWSDVSEMRRVIDIMQKQPGMKRMAATLERKYGRDSGAPSDRRVYLDMETARAILAAHKAARSRPGWVLEDTVAQLDRLDRMGIKGSGDLREALSEFLNYRSDRPQEDPIKKAERALIGQKVGIDFFPTPKAVAERMVSEANIRPGMRVLEPSAGNGNIAEAIRAAGVAPDVAEISQQLRDVLTAKGFNIVANDFMDVSGQYDRIIMNPPFSNSKDIKHVRKAYDLLAPGGRVVAIVGEGAMFRGDGKATGFRSWLDEQGATTEKLPANTFQDKSLLATTGANARLVIIDKPAARLSTAEPTTPKGQQARQWLADRPDVTVVDRQDQLPPGGTEIRAGTRVDGMYDPATGKVYVVAENIPHEARARWVAAHEGGHKGFDALNKATNGEAGKRLTMLRNNRTVRQIADRIGAERGTSDAQVHLEEAIAEVIAASESGNFDAIRGRYGVSADQLSLTRNVVQRFMDWLRTWFQQRGATDADVKQLMRDIIAESRQGSADGNARLSTAPGTIDVDGKQRPTTNSQGRPIAPDEDSIRNFWRWFGASRVVDAEGRPMVMYHGTRSEFSKFGNIGGRFKISAGYYFTTSQKRASVYADSMANAAVDWNMASPFAKDVEQGAQVLPVYLKSENPLRVSDKDGPFNAPEDAFDAKGGVVVQSAKTLGHDGVLFSRSKNDGFDESAAVVFSANQIKSATGNVGSFDGTNPDIRFSTVGDAVDYFRTPKTARGMTDAVLGLFKTHGTFNVLNKTVDTQFHKATKDPLFKRVYDAVQNLISDGTHYAMEAETQAPDVLLAMKSLKDIGRAFKNIVSPAYRKDIEAITKPLFVNIEGEQGVKQRVFSDAELKKDFGLTEKQVEMYRQYRAAIDTSIDRLGQTILMRMGRTLGLDVESMRNTSMQETADELRAALNLRIKSAEDRISAAQQEVTRLDRQSPYSRGGKSLQIDEQGRIRQDFIVTEKDLAPEEKRMADAESELSGLQQSLGELNTIATNIRKLQDSGYTPAMRFGKYAVTGYNGDKVEFFSLYESRMAANLQAAKLRRDNPAWNVQQGQIDPKAHELFSKVPPDMAELFGKFMGLEENEAFKQYVALAASSRSALKRQLERQGTAGFSEDALRVLASFITSNSRAAASNLNGSEINDALVATRDSKRGDVMKEARELVDYVQNPKEETPFLRGLMFTHFMGGSLAAGMVNMTQPVLMTAPHLSQYVKAGDLTRIMQSSMKIATTGKGASQSLSRAMDRAAEEGITDPHEIYQLMAEASGSTFGRSLASRAFNRAWGGFFSASEAWNRRVTFAAAFQTAEKMTPEALREAGFDNAYDFAKNAINETQGVYNKGNRPNWARGPIGSTVFTFKQFSISYMEWLSRLPIKQKMIALGMLSVAAGLEGLPFAEDLEDLIDTIGQHLGFATNSKATVNRFMSGLMGDGLSDFMLHGFSALPGMPLDVSARMSLSNLIPGTRLFNPSAKDKGREIAEVAGAPGSFAMSLVKAGSGDGAVEAMPKALKDVYKAVEIATTGEYRDTKGNKVVNADLVDAFVKGIGFQPAHVAEKGRTTGMVQRDIDIQKRVESEISGQWARGIADKKPDEVTKARERLMEWNADNPELPVRIGLAQIRQKIGEMQRSKDERIIRKAPPEIRQRIAAELQ